MPLSGRNTQYGFHSNDGEGKSLKRPVSAAFLGSKL